MTVFVAVAVVVVCVERPLICLVALLLLLFFAPQLSVDE